MNSAKLRLLYVKPDNRMMMDALLDVTACIFEFVYTFNRVW